MNMLELKIPPLVLVILFALAMYAISLLAPAVTLHIPVRDIVAVTVALFGALIVLSGVVAFRSHHTTVNPLVPSDSSTIVHDGIYRLSRNPMYLGFLLILIAWGVWLSNIISVLLLPCFVIYMNTYQIRPEERALQAKFGKEFEQYMATVRRWL